MKFFKSLESLVAISPPYPDPFIVQIENPLPQNNSRQYIVFKGISEYTYYLAKGRFNTCHEVFIDSTYNQDGEIYARPAFDFDCKPPKECIINDEKNLLAACGIPFNWVKILEEEIIRILCKQYPSKKEVLSSREGFVWLTSPSKEKVSKHLVLRDIYFVSWKSQMKLLVEDLMAIDFVKKILDDAIYRKSGSLRLPLNKKKDVFREDGSVEKTSPLLLFDNPKHKFEDGIIVFHEGNKGCFLSLDLLSPEYKEKFGELNGKYINPLDRTYSQDVDLDYNLVEKAFLSLDSRWNTGLQLPSDTGNSIITLLRATPGKCPISGRIHHRDNAYIFTRDNQVFFGCYRNCKLHNGKKVINITPFSGKEDILARIRF